MDFTQRDARSHQTAHAAPATATSSAGRTKISGGRFRKLSSVFSTIMLGSIGVLLIALAMSFVFAPGRNEEKYVDKSKYQAVFLNGGQVYFGKITALNSKYLRVADIYYLRVNQQVQPGQTANTNDVSLVKLGCELHGPADEMLVNREQVVFWENLKSDGQVGKAVAEYKKQNPNGQKCEAQPAASSDANKATTSTPAATTPKKQ